MITFILSLLFMVIVVWVVYLVIGWLLSLTQLPAIVVKLVWIAFGIIVLYQIFHLLLGSPIRFPNVG